MKRSDMVTIPIVLGALALGIGLGVSTLSALGASNTGPASRVAPDKKIT
jgi:hypothetical protein